MYRTFSVTTIPTKSPEKIKSPEKTKSPENQEDFEAAENILNNPKALEKSSRKNLEK